MYTMHITSKCNLFGIIAAQIRACAGNELPPAVDSSYCQPWQRSDLEFVWSRYIAARRLAHKVSNNFRDLRSRQLPCQCFWCLNLGIGDAWLDRIRRTDHKSHTMYVSHRPPEDTPAWWCQLALQPLHCVCGGWSAPQSPGENLRRC